MTQTRRLALQGLSPKRRELGREEHPRGTNGL
jgi:hypothetical protein